MKIFRFKDLVFQPHPNVGDIDKTAVHAVFTAPDGTRVSVIRGKHFYSDEDTYEVMSDRYRISFDSVKGWQTPKQIDRHLQYIQRNPKK